MKGRRWTYNKVNIEKQRTLIEELNISPITAKVLMNRGVEEVAAAKLFLEPTLNQLYDPFLLKDMLKVVERIKKAIINKESIWIYGDYDVDGVSSTALLLKYFKDFHYPVHYYIPHRMEEGYGLNTDAFNEIHNQGGKLIITVDCGITSVQEVDYAKELGMDVIITDHHECQGELPRAYGIINPKQTDCQYPYKALCGCGIALKLVQALTPKEEFMKRVDQYIDIAALATVADIVPLVDENRIIVKNGLEVIANTTNNGIRALIEISGLKGKSIHAGHIGFMLAPRINAAGRMGHAEVGVKLLTTEDPIEAMELANLLDRENKQRQQLEMEIYNQAVEMVENEENNNRSFFVLHNDGWHHGVIGIVASRIVEKYYKPTVILSIEDGVAKGSARSIASLNIFEALNQCKDLFQKFGGHEQAAGLSMEVHHLEDFKARINQVTNSLLTEEDFLKELSFDDILNTEDVCDKLLEELKILEPHGMGNPSPKFIARNLKTTYLKAVGTDGKHLRAEYEGGNKKLSAIGFGLGPLTENIQAQEIVDVLFTPEYNYYNGSKTIQLNLKDMAAREVAESSTIQRKYYKSLQVQDKECKEENLAVDVQNIVVNDTNDSILLDLLNSDDPPILILCNTLEKAYNLYYLTGIRRRGTKKQFTLDFEHINKSPVLGDVHVIINPNIEKIDFRRYNKIILYDQFFSPADFNCFVASTDLERTYFFYRENDEAYNYKILEETIPCRRRLIDLYKIFMELGKGSEELPMEKLIDEIIKRVNFSVNEKLILNALELFHEGELLNYLLTDSYVKLIPLKVRGKINIEDLEAYKSQQKLFLQHEKYKKHISQIYLRRK
ncbi:single-stranded-DNA-specific exonuclease RecJ [Alkaliphilus serpentinus]|uniref:Single-stranded-DNA-specific exonuclease RecJ n=1 Tax=Alkaliphilus serpentinus TaxID=1482731 RepID=A0A833M8Z0_9FIRM|nr:single-stranded-DNA-specific exonuclease RecJ [Alkaliphilus serpentinus]KAB3527671.1 single-stranded-DNA-specific exonuclease RecJ [Alkaliphilus serpentinus]